MDPSRHSWDLIGNPRIDVITNHALIDSRYASGYVDYFIGRSSSRGESTDIFLALTDLFFYLVDWATGAPETYRDSTEYRHVPSFIILPKEKTTQRSVQGEVDQLLRERPSLSLGHSMATLRKSSTGHKAVASDERLHAQLDTPVRQVTRTRSIPTLHLASRLIWLDQETGPRLLSKE
ncbi:LOW QUALITY PROTEIN: hypothetical protein Cgig2_023749 [Carnegiea gigantea]|uniref:Uncharacterized protein n=1 Tax=Carnegiea gigantea TaxID=171969 RepID=A0A9Q1KCH9_9CARY|nr:LOW QUALITY PROTEIN: hypothetical protein Cgig2_023749 [Carnegiea gigantea]